MKKRFIILTILISLLLISPVSALTIQNTYINWRGEIKPVSEFDSNPYYSSGYYKISDMGNKIYVFYDFNKNITLPKNEFINYSYSYNKISPIIKIPSLNKLDSVSTQHNGSVYYVPIFNSLGMNKINNKIIKINNKWNWDNNYIIFDSSPPINLNGTSIENTKYLTTYNEIKIVDNEIRLYVDKQYFLNATYPLYMKFNSFTLQTSTISSCWNNGFCDNIIINGSNTSNLILYNTSKFTSNIDIISSIMLMNDISNTTHLIDETGNIDMKLINSPARVFGSMGTGVYFDQNLIQFAFGNNSPSLNFGYSDFSAGGTFRTTDTSGYIISNVNWGVGYEDGWYVSLSTGKIGCNLIKSTGGNAIVTVSSIGTVNDNKTRSFLCTRKNNILYLFINGILENYGDVSAEFPVNNTNSLFFAQGTDVHAGAYFDGMLDEVWITNYSTTNRSSDLFSYNNNGNVTFNSSDVYNNNMILLKGFIPADSQINIYDNRTGTLNTPICQNCSTYINYTYNQKFKINFLSSNISISTPILSSIELNTNISGGGVPIVNLTIPTILKDQNFSGVEIVVLYVILFLSFIGLLIVMYSNDKYIVVIIPFILLIVWLVIILPETFYKVIVVSETTYSENNCVLAVTSNYCSTIISNATKSIIYGREIVVLPFRIKSSIIFLIFMSFSKIFVLRKKRTNEVFNIDSD